MAKRRARDLNWNAIRTLRGSQQNAFEELCCQLARREPVAGAIEGVRKGTPDAGVEFYRVMEDGSEIAWQAKYWTDRLADSQWKQLDSSVREALDGHPKLARYIVCVPLDRPDARVPGQRSMMDRWDARCRKWQGWAAALGRNVRFDYWGSSELIDRLTRPSAVGLESFWFALPELHPKQFVEHVESQTYNAGPRYTRDVHVDVPLAQYLTWLVRSAPARRRVEERVEEAVVALRSFHHSAGRALPGFDLSPLARASDAMVDRVNGYTDDPGEGFRLDDLRGHAVTAIEGVVGATDALVNHPDAEGHGARRERWDRFAGHKFREEIYAGGHARTAVSNLLEFVHADRSRLADEPLLLIVGEAGSGKTHFLCDAASRHATAGQPVLLAFGAQFDQAPPLGQLPRLFGLDDVGGSDLLASLDVCAEASGTRALVVIDALNEGPGVHYWQNHLPGLLAAVRQFRRVALVLSIRTPYAYPLFGADSSGWPRFVRHTGFAEVAGVAVERYFAHYGIEVPALPTVEEEFSNPLFLKLYCGAVRNRGLRHPPVGIDGIAAVIDFFIDALRVSLFGASHMLDDPSGAKVRTITSRLADELGSGRRLDERRSTELIAMVTTDGRAADHFRVLLAEGMLIRQPRYDTATRALREDIGFGYERLTDHLVAASILDRLSRRSEAGLASFTAAGLRELRARVRARAYRRSLLEALCIHVAERMGRELVEFVPKWQAAKDVPEAFVGSLVGRSAAGVTPFAVAYARALAASGPRGLQTLFPVLLRVACRPGHPLNATFLDAVLGPMTIAERDAVWSVYLHREWTYGGYGQLHTLVDWFRRSPTTARISVDAALLAGTALSWLLTSANRYLRDRATKSLAALLSHQLVVARQLVERFVAVDDRYVLERVLCAAYGACLRSSDAAGTRGVAEVALGLVLRRRPVVPHALARHYAACIVELARDRSGPADGAVPAATIHPPFDGSWPKRLPSKAALERRYEGGDAELGEAGRTVSRSVMPPLADWGRYVVTTRDWTRIPRHRPRPPEKVADAMAVIDKFRRRLRGTAGVAFDAYVGDLAASKRGAIDPGALDVRRGLVQQALRGPLAREFVEYIDPLLRGLSRSYRGELHVPEFPDEEVMRFVLKKVAELGWTSARFGDFDRGVHSNGRSGHKAERIGKKYQWLAYHEALARLSDTHWPQRRTDVRTWAAGLRDIDPTMDLPAPPTREPDPHTEVSTWWAPLAGASLRLDLPMSSWLPTQDGLPDWRSLIEPRQYADGPAWSVLASFQQLAERRKVGIDREAQVRREIWWMIDCFLVRAADLPAVKSWARTHRADYFHREQGHGFYSQYLGEYPHGRVFTDATPDEQRHGWRRHEGMPAVDLLATVDSYSASATGYDCSLEADVRLYLPSPRIIDGLSLRSPGVDGRWTDGCGRVIAQDPAVLEPGPTSLLIDAAAFRELLRAEGLAAFWMIRGEKDSLGGDREAWPGRMLYHTVCWYEANGAFRAQESTKFDDPKATRR